MTDTLTPTDVTDIVRRLRAVTRRIEGFFESQVRRMETAMSQLNEMQSEYDVVRRLSADLDMQRNQWQLERQSEISRLTQASEALAKSWHELEQRQRDLSIVAEAKSSPQPKTPEAPQSPAATVSAQPSEASLFEIQQLRNQVNEHKRRNK